MIAGLQIEPLAWHPEAPRTLQGWFEAEWPSHYGARGPGDARRDLEAYSNADGLPFGVVALVDGSVCGAAALKGDSIASHGHLSPWAAAGLVRRDLRGRRIGQRLLIALEEHARAVGSAGSIATGTAESLRRRCGWRLLERIIHAGETLGIYAKAL